MADDIVDFDDLEDFDYTDLDINPADLDIENLERELGLVNDDAKKESTPLAKTSSDFPAAKSQTGAPEKKEPEDQMAAKASSSSAAATGTTTATTSTVTPSLQTKQAPAAIASPNTKSSQGPSVRSQTVQKPSNGGSMGSLSPRKPGGAPRPNNNFQGAGGIMYPMPPANMVPMGQYPFAQGMMGMNMMMMPPPAPPPAFPAPFPQMGFLGAQKIHINPKFAASRPDIFGANDNNSKRTANQQQQQRLQPAMQNTPHSLQENSDSNALKRQRELIMEQQRKRRERREAEGKGAIMGGGVATDGSHPQHQGRTSPPISTVVHNGTHQQQPGTAEKRDITIKGLGTPKGISIKGAAAAAAAAAAATTTVANSPPLQQYQPPHRRRLAGASSAPSSSPSPRSDSLPSARMVNPVAGTPSVLSRVTPRGTKRPSSPPDVKKYEPAAKKAAIPIQTAGKSATITIANVSSNVSENDIMGLAKSIPGRIENVKLDKSAKKAIVAFDSPESAVIFRRQYNRSQFHGEVIIVTFCT